MNKATSSYQINRLYETLFTGSSDGIALCDLKQVVVKINPAFTALFGFTEEEAIGQRLDDLVVRTSEMKQESLDLIQRIFSGEHAFLETLRMKKDGTLIPVVLVGLIHTPPESEPFFFWKYQDITPRIDAQKKAEESERQYRMLFENVQEGILGVDAQARITVVNPRAVTLLGYAPQEIIGRTIFEFMDPATRDRARKRFSSEGSNSSEVFELGLRHNEGHFMPVRVKGTPVFDREGNFAAGVALLEDLREIRNVENELRKQSSILRRVWNQTITALSYVSERRDPYTAGHQKRVRKLALEISKSMGLDPNIRAGLHVAALLHDIGKISIPSEILTKPGRLTQIEYDLIKAHSKTGHEILGAIEFPWPVAEIVYQHHEAYDGSGYPRGLSGENILLEARILATADAYEAMSSHRPYRAAMGKEFAIKEMQSLSGKRYAPDVVEHCLKVLAEGFTWGEAGEIEFQDDILS